jgi:hypothetical protein
MAARQHAVQATTCDTAIQLEASAQRVWVIGPKILTGADSNVSPSRLFTDTRMVASVFDCNAAGTSTLIWSNPGKEPWGPEKSTGYFCASMNSEISYVLI